MTDFEAIKVDVTDGIATLTLNRPERLNSFTVAMHGEVRAALDAIAADRCDSLPRPDAAPGAGFARARIFPIARSRPTPKASISALRSRTSTSRCCNGCARCRCRRSPRSTALPPGRARTSRLRAISSYAAQSASFIQSFSKLGLVPDCGGTWWLPRLIGPARAMGLTLLGEKLSADAGCGRGV